MSLFPVKVAQIRLEACGVISIRLVSADGGPLPSAPSGSHVDLFLKSDLRRSYSLYRPSNGVAYEIAVQLDEQGRGGSRHVHENIAEGHDLVISGPRNNFELRAGNPTVLIAGGIGITPIYAMLQSLVEDGRAVRLLYCARSRVRAAFLENLEELAAQGVAITFLFEDEDGRPNLTEWMKDQNAAAYYYCCGPSGMLNAFEDACLTLGYKNYFVERFAAGSVVETTQREGYVVELARSGRTLTVPAGKTLLDVLLEAGIDMAYSCREGACGSCETAVIAGEIDHRDVLLSEAERNAGQTMFVCVSGCKSEKLVLDL